MSAQPKEEPRFDLVAHLREQIAPDPEGYAERRLPYVVDGFLADMTAERLCYRCAKPAAHGAACRRCLRALEGR